MAVRRSALVTGAGRGVGKAIALRLAADGFDLVVTDIDGAAAEAVAAEINASGRQATFRRADVTARADVAALIHQAVETFGRLDVLVNNAGICPTTTLLDVTDEEWHRVLDVNLYGTFLTCQTAIPIMQKQQYGRIVNIASVAGRMGGVFVSPAYTASKAGVIGLTRAVARFVAQDNITANAVAPGTIESPMTGAWGSEKLEQLRAAIPVGRLGTPDDVAAIVSYLASEEAGFITGATVDINGGLLMA